LTQPLLALHDRRFKSCRQEEAQRRASELLGNEGIALLDKAARKVGMSQAGH